MAAEDDKINAPLVAAIGIVSTLLLVGTIVGLQVMFFAMSEAETARKDPQETAFVLSEYRSSQQEKLETYKTLDPVKGIYAIPIGRAMDLVVHEVNAQHDKEKPRVP
jgi:hypothetical protein